MKKIIAVVLFIVGLSLFQASCKKNKQYVPYVAIDTYLNLNLPSYINLNGIGGWTYVSGGNDGLIVYRQTQTVFMVYDRYCTYNVDGSCGAAAVDSSNVTVSCACDGSQYQIYDGAVIQGPATTNLHVYRADYNESSNTLHIYN
jgi:nitrite reductase/ring-hydroxylating ferredoxin subunit